MNNFTNDLKVMEEGEVGKECAQTLELLPSLTGKTAVPEIPGTTRTTSFVSKSEKNAIIGPPKDVKRCGVKGWFAFVPSFTKLINRIPRRPSYNVPVNVRQLEQCPRGYPNLAAFLDSDESFTLYRRFGYLQARLLLDKQDEMRKLEEKLDEMDKEDEENRSKRLITRDLKEQDAGPRRELFKAIEERFCEYAHILTTAQTLMAFNRPAASDYQSVANYIYNREPVVEDERTWIYCKEDMITLRAGREHAWLDTGIERLLRFLHCQLIEWLFCSKETKLKSRGIEVYYDRSRINAFVNTLIALIILLLLVVPIYILYHLIHDVNTGRAYAICIGVLLVSTLAFSAVLSLFTRARRHETLAAAAAYCAVLVVFLGNVSP